MILQKLKTFHELDPGWIIVWLQCHSKDLRMSSTPDFVSIFMVPRRWILLWWSPDFSTIRLTFMILSDMNISTTIRWIAVNFNTIYCYSHKAMCLVVFFCVPCALSPLSLLLQHGGCTQQFPLSIQGGEHKDWRGGAVGPVGQQQFGTVCACFCALCIGIVLDSSFLKWWSQQSCVKPFAFSF